MELTLLTVPDCPNAAAFEERLAAALASHPGVVLRHRVVTGEREAAEAGMHGSPTLLIDGTDPFAAPGLPAVPGRCRPRGSGAVGERTAAGAQQRRRMKHRSPQASPRSARQAGRSRPQSSRPPEASRPGGERPGLSGLWWLLVPLACCGGPVLIAGLAAAGALAWGGAGLGAGVLVAVTVLVIGRRRRSRACCEPGTAAARRPAAR